jgi:ketosteroid isomerase-like protein
MKTTIITLLCLFVFSATALAQTQVEKLFQATLAEYEKNPMKAIQERASANYVLIAGSGHIVDKATTAAVFKNVSSVAVSFKDLSVRQFGNTVIATGKEHSVRHYNDGTPDLSSDYLSTYVYEIKGNNLIYLSAQHSYLSDNAFDQENVKKTIETETNAYHAGDVELMNKQWAESTNYVERQQASLKALGAPAYLKGDALKAFGEKFKQVHKPTGQTYKISDYEAHVGTTNAWATYTQETLNADGKLANKTREMRILERLGGWKIVAMSHVEL